MKKVEVVPHDPAWRNAFEEEAKHVSDMLGETVTAIHHIGGTSIPYIYAKPVIDILVEVTDIAEVDERTSAMESLRYEVMGEFGISGRRYFRKDDSRGTRTHQIHTFEKESDQVIRHLAFRDYLIDHPDEAKSYSDLKCQLAAAHPTDADAYMDGKDPFIQEIDRRAAIWKRTK